MQPADLNDSNYLLFCVQHYNNPGGTDDEFVADLRRIKFLKKLVTRYKDTGELKERLLLNHLIILGNVFGRDALARIIWLKMADYLPEIKPFMVALGLLPKMIKHVRGKNYDTDDITMNMNVVRLLRQIPTE